jgi:hypothetical protein
VSAASRRVCVTASSEARMASSPSSCARSSRQKRGEGTEGPVRIRR